MTKQELEMCITEYGKDIYSFCRYLTDNPQEADDLYQDTFLTATEVKEKIDFGNSPKSYLLSIALRLWKNKKRKSAWRNRIAQVQPLPEEQDIILGASMEPTPEERIASKEQDVSIRMAVRHLPEKLRIVVLLYYMEDMATAQIARSMQIPVGTVLSRLHQARKLLKKELEDVFNG